jgi:hypothetical protein
MITVDSSPLDRQKDSPTRGKTPRWTNARRGASNAPQLLPPIPTFPAPVQRKNRAAFLAAPRWAQVESFPAGPVPPIASVGERKPADGYFVGRERYVSRSDLREPPRRTNARRGALNAPQLLPPIPTFPAPVQRKNRAAFLAAPRRAPVDSFPPERFRPLLRLGKGNPLTVISSVAGDMFPAPVHGKSRAAFLPRPAELRGNRSRRSDSAHRFGGRRKIR